MLIRCPHEKCVVKTVARTMPAVVSVTVLRNANEVAQELERIAPKKARKSGLIPEDKINARGMVQVGGGSGFVVDANGLILTNKHVIEERSAAYVVITDDGAHYEAEVAARDPLDDIAILKIKPERPLPALPLTADPHLDLGMTVLAFGNALGISKNTVSMGIVSGLARSIEAKTSAEAPTQEMRGLIQTDAAINPGNSGGPLTDMRGVVIGVNTAVVSGAANIGFAIPAKAAERDLHDLRAHGKITRPLLGIRYLTLSDDISEKLRLPVSYGALVTREHPLDIPIVEGSPADTAGLKERDIVLEWNNQKITQEKNLQDFLEESEAKESVVLTVLRGGKKLKKPVTLAERR